MCYDFCQHDDTLFCTCRNCVFQRRWVKLEGGNLTYYNSDKVTHTHIFANSHTQQGSAMSCSCFSLNGGSRDKPKALVSVLNSACTISLKYLRASKLLQIPLLISTSSGINLKCSSIAVDSHSLFLQI